MRTSQPTRTTRGDVLFLALLLVWFAALAVSQSLASGMGIHEFLFMAPMRTSSSLLNGHESNGLLPNLFYACLWSGTTPRSDLFQRLPVMFCALLALVLTFVLGQRIGRNAKMPHLGVYGAFLLAASATTLGVASHCRFFAPSLVTATASTLLLMRYAEKPTWGRLLTYILAMAVNLGTMMLTCFLILPHLVYLAARRWRQAGCWRDLAIVTVALMLVGGWLFARDNQALNRLNYGAPNPNPITFFQPFLVNGGLGDKNAYSMYSTASPDSAQPLAWLQVATLLTLVGAGAQALYSRHQRRKQQRKEQIEYTAQPERDELLVRTEQMERTEGLGRAERPERTEQPERAELLVRTEQMERTEGMERVERPERTEQPERAELLVRTEQMERTELPAVLGQDAALCPLIAGLGLLQFYAVSHLICNVQNSSNFAPLWPFWALTLAVAMERRVWRYLMLTALAYAAPYTHWQTLPNHSESCKNSIYVLAMYRRPTEPVIYTSGAYFSARYLQMLDLDARRLKIAAPMALQTEDLPAMPRGTLRCEGRCEYAVEGWAQWQRRPSDTVWIVVDTKTAVQDEMFGIVDHVGTLLAEMAQRGQLRYLERQMTQDFTIYRVTFTEP